MERVLSNKANYLVRLGHEVTIITTDQKGRPSFYDLHPDIKCIDLGINYTEDLDKGLLFRIMSFFFKQKKHRRLLESHLKSLRADIVVSMFDNDVGFVPKIKDGSKKVVEIHFSRFKRLQYGRKGLMGWIDKVRSGRDLKIVKRYDRFVVLTEEDKNYWGALDNIVVIPNANSFESDEKSSLMHKQVIAVGRYDYQKGFDDLIHIWKRVISEAPGWKLKIYGHGPLKEVFEALIDGLGLQESIELAAPVRNIKEAYLNSSILVMTSRYEGLPMVLLESQVCGVPMVSYMCKCGPTDVIKDGQNGFLVEEGNQDQFAEKLLLLMKDDVLRKRMGLAAIDNSKNYGEEKIMQRWISLFEGLMN